MLINNIRDKQLAYLIVKTTSDKVFDGDEKSQDRMLKAIQVMGLTGQTTINWKLANNSIVEITLEELKEALVLAGQATSKIILEEK